VAQKVSGLSASPGKEAPHGDSSLSLRQVRMEGLGSTSRPSVKFDIRNHPKSLP